MLHSLARRYESIAAFGGPMLHGAPANNALSKNPHASLAVCGII